MKNYIISYWFKDCSKNYFPFYDAIKKNYPEWQHPLEETWFVHTDDSAQQIINNIKPFLSERDCIFVAEITDNYAGWMAKSAWEWLKKYKENESLGN